jgi:dienelactone hydrolase
MLVPPKLQALDAFNAANYLRAQPNVIAERIGVIGFSHGDWAVLKAVLDNTMKEAASKPFIAAVAFYPYCDPPQSALRTDTLILIGEADDRTPADLCVRWVYAVQRNGHRCGYQDLSGRSA